MTYYYRRSIEQRAGVAQYVVYAVTPIKGEKPDPVPVVAAFPEHWHPMPQPGMCLFALGTPSRLYETFVPRNQFRHYQRITEVDALALYLDLLR